MKEPSSILEAQVQSMLEQLRRHEAREIRLILDDSHRIAAEIRRDAHRQAREEMHRRIERERQLMRQTKQTAAARLATRRRLAAHARVNARIAAAWKLLPDAMARRWADAAERRKWCDMLLEEAFRTLQGPNILVEYPAGWNSKELDALLEKIRRKFNHQPEARADSSLAAGLRIHSGNAWLDGSVAGLLAQRSRIESQLLVELAGVGQSLATESADTERIHG